VSAAPWDRRPERGSRAGIAITSWLFRHGAKPVARALLWPIAGYFWATGREARRGSLAYLRRVHAAGGLPSPPSQRHVFLHELEFARTILDRVGFWLGEASSFQLRLVGDEHLVRARTAKRGLLVLGSHLGSFDAIRLAALEHAPLRVNVLMYTAHAARINDALGREAREGATRVRVIPIRPGTLAHVLEARECIRRGEVVAILADRSPPGGAGGHAQPVEFLGATAWLFDGPMRLAAALGCPVVFMTGLRTGTDAYEIHIQPLADRVTLPRPRRDEALGVHMQRFADVLAGYCLRAPYQWFNFFDFWEPRPTPSPEEPPASRI
jgi:predicted LPLAT superfamily acyltransferase